MTVPPGPGGARPPRGVRVTSLRGTPVHVTPAWLAVHALVLVAGTFALARLADEPVGVRHALAVLGVWAAGIAAVGAHEAAHGAASRARGNPPQHYALTASGGFTGIDARRETPRTSLAVSAAGPAANLGLALLAALVAAVSWYFLAASGVLPHSAHTFTGLVTWPLSTARSNLTWEVTLFGGAGWFAACLGVTNLAMGLVNLLPALPLDGGRMVAAAAWGRTGRRGAGVATAARVGLATSLVGALVVLALPVWSPWRVPAWVVVLALVLLAALAAANVEALRTRPGPGSGEGRAP